MTTDTFAWAGGSALPHHINAMGHEATSLLELPADVNHARPPTQESRSLQDENGRRTSFIDTIWVVMISNGRIFCDKPYRPASVRLVKNLRGYCILAPTLTSSCDFTPAFVIIVIYPLFFKMKLKFTPIP